MRKYLSYLLCMLAAASLAGCRGIGVEPDDIPADARLQLRSTELVATRTAGVPDLNENLISQVQLFFSDNGKDILYRTEVEVNEADGIVEDLPLTLPAAAMESLFSADNTCQLFVVANAPAIPEDVNTVSGVKAEAITLAKQVTAQDSFVMTGVATDITRRTDNSVAGSVDLKRVAAKIEVVLNVHKSIVIGDGENQTTWVSDVDSEHMSMAFSGMTSSTVGGTGSADPYNFVQHDFDSSKSTDDIWVVKQTVPFYSYPVSWDHNSEKEIILNIPWKRSDVEGDEFKTYQYQIPVNYDDMELVSNYLYKITVNVSILGSLTGDVVVTPCSYVVVDWGTGVINTELSRPKYLVVDENYVEMNNVEQYSVGYASSDEVTVEIISSSVQVTYEDDNKDYDAVFDFDETGVTVSGSYVTLTHQLDNTRTDAQYDFKSLTFVVRVSHKNNINIYEDITFVQYPAMYITSQPQSRSSVIINGSTSRSTGNWWYVNGSAISGNEIFGVTVSAFDETTSNYIICDPRVSANNDEFVFYTINSSGANSSVHTTVEDATGDNTLTGYRAAISGAASENLVAPSFIMASSYGAYDGQNTNLYTETSAKYRCAAYQEAGYPAGRWRLPTPAELQVVGKLCAEGKLDNIFYDNYTYASSGGMYTYNSNGTFTPSSDRASRSVRCVYDVWYWTDKCADDSKFIWAADGDVANGAKNAHLVSVE